MLRNPKENGERFKKKKNSCGHFDSGEKRENKGEKSKRSLFFRDVGGVGVLLAAKLSIGRNVCPDLAARGAQYQVNTRFVTMATFASPLTDSFNVLFRHFTLFFNAFFTNVVGSR